MQHAIAQIPGPSPQLPMQPMLAEGAGGALQLTEFGEGMLVGLFLLSVGLYLVGVWLRARTRRSDKAAWLWLTPRNLVPFSSRWKLLLVASGVYTAAAMFLSLLLIVAFRIFCDHAEPHNLTEEAFAFPGVVFVFVTGLLGVASVLNTMCLLQRRSQEIYSFPALADALERDIEDGPAPRGAAWNETFFIDFVPAVGIVSAKDSHIRIGNTLQKLARREDSISHFIFLASKRRSAEEHHSDSLIDGAKLGPMEEAIESMVVKAVGPAMDADARRNRCREIRESSDQLSSNLDQDFGLVWYSSRVNFEHYYVDRDSAIAYYVIPDEDAREQRNQLRGSVLSDVTHVSYLQEVCRTYLRQAVTPKSAIVRKDAAAAKLKFVFSVGQRRIRKIEVLCFDLNKRPLEGGVCTVEPSEESIEGISMGVIEPDHEYETDVLPETKWIQVKLYKARVQHEIRAAPEAAFASPTSFFVPLKEIT